MALAHTGLVENKYNLWVHPPRFSLFEILELNPFPYIKLPARLGNEWTDSLKIGAQWSNPLWKVWTGSVVLDYKYKITEHKSMIFRKQAVLCWVIESSAKSRLGETKLISYFNEEYGFIQMDYQNIDGSNISFNLL